MELGGGRSSGGGGAALAGGADKLLCRGGEAIARPLQPRESAAEGREVRERPDENAKERGHVTLDHRRRAG